MSEPVKIGISSCLLGNHVRYDGNHKLDRYLRDTLGQYFEFVPVCPEVECGLPVPREAMRLVGDPQSPRLVTVRSGIDHSVRMRNWAAQRVKALEKENLCGFIFKKNSPSSGMMRVAVYNAAGRPERKGSGLFAKAFMDHFPRLPVEDEGRLQDPGLRENFIERIFALQRWRQVLVQGMGMDGLVDFHTREKLLLMSHSPHHCRQLGKLVAGGKQVDTRFLHDEYERFFMAALQLKATRAKHTNVLQHIQGYFKKLLTADEKQEMSEIINSYRNTALPLIVPVTLAQHYVRKYGQTYLARQTYLNPHPLDLQLRNHA
jgi:uncharacterized protein YbgA (DUF1722 family)/uncharacterized protein YbbK (DUF523 family)